jgi:prophage regulatory protein
MQPIASETSERLLALSEVQARFGLSKSTIYRLLTRGEFPKPLKISPGRVAWCERDLHAWLKARGA